MNNTPIKIKKNKRIDPTHCSEHMCSVKIFEPLTLILIVRMKKILILG